MSFEEVAGPLQRWSEAGLRAGVATLFRVKRSAPRPPGARFAANEKGDLAGSVSSGCVEGDLLEHIRQVVAEGRPRVVHYGITDEMAAGVGLSCGGEIDVLVAPYRKGNPVWSAVAEAVRAERAALLLTLVTEGQDASQMVVLDDGTRQGSLGGQALDDAAVNSARSLLDTGGTMVVPLERTAADVFAEAFLPPPKLAIIGATPVAAALCHLASYLGLSVTIIDPRKAFADAARFPQARQVLVAWPDEAMKQIQLDRYWSVVALAHDQKLDVPGLAAALRAGCLYVGQIGGGRTQEQRRKALAEQGLPEADLERIHGPVGLDIGAKSPQEIALSILAEVVAVRRGKLS